MYRLCLWIYVYAISCRKTMKKNGFMLQTMVFVGVVILKTRFNRHIWRIFEIPKALRYLVVEFGRSARKTPCKIFTWNLKMEVLVEIWDDFHFQLIWFLGFNGCLFDLCSYSLVLYSFRLEMIQFDKLYFSNCLRNHHLDLALIQQVGCIWKYMKDI